MIYESKDFIDTTKTNFFEGGIFVGPGEYNSYENKLYFATTEGFYRSAIPDKRRIKNPELLFTPKLMWERERLAIGVGMAVKKLEFTNDNRLVFLTSNNGIGVYAENELIMLK